MLSVSGDSAWVEKSVGSKRRTCRVLRVTWHRVSSVKLEYEDPSSLPSQVQTSRSHRIVPRNLQVPLPEIKRGRKRHERHTVKRIEQTRCSYYPTNLHHLSIKPEYDSDFDINLTPLTARKVFETSQTLGECTWKNGWHRTEM